MRLSGQVVWCERSWVNPILSPFKCLFSDIFSSLNFIYIQNKYFSSNLSDIISFSIIFKKSCNIFEPFANLKYQDVVKIAFWDSLFSKRSWRNVFIIHSDSLLFYVSITVLNEPKKIKLYQTTATSNKRNKEPKSLQTKWFYWYTMITQINNWIVFHFFGGEKSFIFAFNLNRYFHLFGLKCKCSKTKKKGLIQLVSAISALTTSPLCSRSTFSACWRGIRSSFTCQILIKC